MQAYSSSFRCVSLCLMMAGNAWAEEAAGVKAKVKAEIKAAHVFVQPKPVDSIPIPVDENVLQLDKFVVKGPIFRDQDLLAAARRAAAAKKAKEFSMLTGGLIHSEKFGDMEMNVGLWPYLVPTNETPVKKGDVMLRVDLLRMKW